MPERTVFQRHAYTHTYTKKMRVSLLTSIDATEHVHLIIGSNPIAAARCAKSIEVGARPILIAPEDAEVHFGLRKRVDDGEVRWVRKVFEESDLAVWGREEMSGYADAVFVTTGSRSPQSKHHHSRLAFRRRRLVET